MKKNHRIESPYPKQGITLAKSIELTEFLFVRRPQLIDKDYDAAIKLLIEAGKRLQELRTNPRLYPIEPLPSETKEEERR